MWYCDLWIRFKYFFNCRSRARVISLLEFPRFCFFQWCNPSNSTSTWSNRDGVECDDGNPCTRADMCQRGHCTATPFNCNQVCQFCNGNNCSMKTGFGFAKSKCMCKIAGESYCYVILILLQLILATSNMPTQNMMYQSLMAILWNQLLASRFIAVLSQ